MNRFSRDDCVYLLVWAGVANFGAVGDDVKNYLFVPRVGVVG